MKKLLALILVLMMVLPCAAALADSYDGSDVTITFRHITKKDNQLAVLDQAIADFNVLYPNIHVELDQRDNYSAVLDTTTTNIASQNKKETPNITVCYADHVATYNQSNAVVALDDLINDPEIGLTEEQKADYVPGFYAEGANFGDGKMYILPFNKSTEVMYYDKTFFDANGLTVPTTWDELEEVCAKIKEIDPNSIPLGYDSEGNWFITMTEQLGTPYTSATEPHFLFNTKENRDFVFLFREWFQEGFVTTAKLYGAYTSGLFTSKEQTRSYMSIGSSAGATYQRPQKGEDGNYPFEVGIATIPQANPDNRKVISQGPSVCIFKKANAQEEAASWLFVKYLTTSVDFQAEFSMASGYVPVIKSVTKNPVYAEFLAKADGGDYVSALSAKVCLEQEDAYYTSPAFNGSSTARDEVAGLMPKCFNIPDGSDVEAEIEKAFEEAVQKCEYSL